MEPPRPYLAGAQRPAVAWGETLALTGLAVALGVWARPGDPLLTGAVFPWPLLGPLLAGLRYGFAHALASGLLLGVVAQAWLTVTPGTPADLGLVAIVGILCCSLIAGEFRDAWERRLTRLERVAEYSENRLGEFTRAYHLLRLSHDQLEQRLAGTSHSLREALFDLRRLLRPELRDEAPASDPFAGGSERILSMFAEYGALGAASLYAVDATTATLGGVWAQIGEMPPVTAEDPLIARALATGELVSVGPSDGESDETALVAAVPLTSARGKVVGIVAVHYMPFFALTSANLTLLAVLAGNVADALINASQGASAEPLAQAFQHELLRVRADARRHGLPAVVVVIGFPPGQLAHEVTNLIEQRRRGLDLSWFVEDDTGARLVVLLPLTDGAGFAGYRARIDTMLRENFGSDGTALGITLQHVVIDRWLSDARLHTFLVDSVGLDEDVAAV